MYIYGHEDGKKGGEDRSSNHLPCIGRGSPMARKRGAAPWILVSRDQCRKRQRCLCPRYRIGGGPGRERERETERVCVVVMRLARAFASPPRSGRHTLPTYKQSRGGQQQQQRGRRGGVRGQNKDSDPRPGRRGPPRCRRSRRGSPSRHGSRRAHARGRKHVNETACRQQGRARGP